MQTPITSIVVWDLGRLTFLHVHVCHPNCDMQMLGRNEKPDDVLVGNVGVGVRVVRADLDSKSVFIICSDRMYNCMN